MGYCVSRNTTRWILAQGILFHQCSIASISNQDLAVLHYFSICALLLTRQQESTIKQHQGGASNGRFNPIPADGHRESGR